MKQMNTLTKILKWGLLSFSGLSFATIAETMPVISHEDDPASQTVNDAVTNTSKLDEKKEDSSSWYSEFKVVPFGFLSDTIGNSIGAAGLVKGAGQPQAALLGAAFISDKGSFMTYLGGYNYQLSERWLVNFDAYSAQFKDYEYYLGPNTRNDSKFEDSIITDGQESRLQTAFRYVLPIGLGSEKGGSAGYMSTREVTSWNPLESGVSSLSVKPFFKSRHLDNNVYDEPESTWGVELKADWDNRDNLRNTTTGSRTQLSLTHAPDTGNENPWTTWEFQNSHYFDLGPLADIFNKQVVAFDFYTAGTPSWDSGTDGNEHRPPEYAGVRLGGLFRQRAFSGGRFTGRAAINYSLEYRVMPDWQPLQNWPIFDLYKVPWWQWVVFTDVGRVADEYKLSTLNQDMQVSVGGAIRFQVEGVVVRTEMAWGDEESVFRVMVNQPF